ncbi:hypothetical protein U27_03315 [Candidatus Vecturithrix granuli]|uniref:Uncharacterized protein n=1 Tax=Vecturithrix granuli TaxID=1499967 RepID=A0A081BVJ8_VECG1|nr:hypothetical protein U27_03315 [Candidatus Vecturithrix granuli]
MILISLLVLRHLARLSPEQATAIAEVVLGTTRISGREDF